MAYKCFVTINIDWCNMEMLVLSVTLKNLRYGSKYEHIIFQFIMERAVVMLLHNLRFMAKSDVVGALFFVHIPDPVSETIDVLIEVIKCGRRFLTSFHLIFSTAGH